MCNDRSQSKRTMSVGKQWVKAIYVKSYGQPEIQVNTAGSKIHLHVECFNLFGIVVNN